MAWTIQKLIDGGMTVHAYCQDALCGHHKQIDLAMLLARLGPDHPAMRDDMVRVLKCSRCNGRAIGLIYSPDPAKTPGMGGNPYIKAKGGQ